MKQFLFLIHALVMGITASADCVGNSYCGYANRDQQAPKADQHVARSGAIFTRDTSNPKLGEEAYKDEKTGLIWSGVISDSVTQQQAEASCENLGTGVRLPTDDEFFQLQDNLGDNSYSPFTTDGKEVLPGLSSHWFWSSSLYPTFDNPGAYIFFGRTGGMADVNRDLKRAVRCVSGS